MNGMFPAIHENQFGLRFETNKRVSLGDISSFLKAIDEFADQELGNKNSLELTHLSVGSVVAIFTAWGAAVGGLATVGLFSVSLAEYIEKRRESRISRSTAKICLDNDIASISIHLSNQEPIIIHASSILAISDLEQLRAEEEGLIPIPQLSLGQRIRSEPKTFEENGQSTTVYERIGTFRSKLTNGTSLFEQDGKYYRVRTRLLEGEYPPLDELLKIKILRSDIEGVNGELLSWSRR